MAIECNEISQVSNELLIAFKDCNKVKNEDLRKFVKLVLAANTCATHTHTKSQITDFAHTHPISDVTGLSMALDDLQLNKEDKTNKQNSLESDGTGSKYPTVDAVNLALSTFTVLDATTTAKGIVKLGGDLGGTADNPTTPTAIHKIGDEIKQGILTLSDGLKIVGNTTSTTATKINVQENDGTINTISKSDLVNVAEVNDVPSLPLIGEAGKIYVVKNVNKIYRWNGTFYQELAVTDISGKINVSEKGVSNGVATLGSDGKVPDSQLPDNTVIEENFTYSGSQSFTLSEIPSNLSVYVNGQYLENTQYTLLDNILTISPTLSTNYRVQVKSTILGSELSSSRFTSYVQKGIMPEKIFQQSPYYTQLAPFITKYFEKNQDVTLVQIGDSFSTNLDYNTTLTDANIRPPLMTEWNLNAQLEEKLRWKEQEYRRFDYPAAFFENLGGGLVSNLSDDYTNWGYNIAGLNLYPELTRVIDGGINSGVSYGFPAGMKRCNFILHTDLQWADTTEIEISEGNGKVEVFNGATWVEANGYTFSAKESATLLGTGQQYHRDQYQKRIKMRSLTDLSAKTVTIQNMGTGRFGYWGIEYSTSEFMFTYIAASKGGHGIESLQKFQEWMVDDFDPDLLLQQCAVINEGASTVEAFQTPEAFAAKFETQYDGFISQGYLVFPYITFIGEQAKIVDPITGKFKTSTFAGETITVPDYINKLASMYLSKNAPFVNIFSRMLEIAFKIDEIKGNNNIYTSAIVGSGKDGNTLTIDSIHPNNYQTEIMTRILFNYFNF